MRAARETCYAMQPGILNNVSMEEQTGTKRRYSKMDYPSTASSVSTIETSDKTGDVSEEEARVAEIQRIIKGDDSDAGSADEDQDTVSVAADWWTQFNAPHKDGLGPVARAAPGNTTEIPRRAYDLLVEWYGAEKILSIPISVVGGQLIDDREARPTDTIGDIIPDLEGDLWVGSSFKAKLGPTEFGRMKLRPVTRNTFVDSLQLECNERLLVEPENAVVVGTLGLNNLGNTCYMNSALQCLAHVEELAAYFVSGQFNQDINRTNPIGHGGHVADAFGELLKNLYTGRGSSFGPYSFKNTIGRYNRAFAGYLQQDSQEFTAFLLDGLHEDLNKVIDKPLTEKPELPDEKIADVAAIEELALQVWDLHKKRNDSIILDLFTGLYKSTLVCPDCKKVSITFDPFTDLTLPLPSADIWLHPATYVSLTGKPQVFEIALHPFATIRELKQQVSGLVGVDAAQLVAADIYTSQVYQFHEDEEIVSVKIISSDVLSVYETAPKSSEKQFPLMVLTRTGGSLTGEPLIIMASETDTLETLRQKLTDRYSDILAEVPSFQIDKLPGNGQVLAAAFGTPTRNFISLDPPSPDAMSVHEEADDDHEEPEHIPSPGSSPGSSPESSDGASSSISALSGPASSPDESFVHVPSSPSSAVTPHPETDASAGPDAEGEDQVEPLLAPGDILVCKFEDKLDFVSPMEITNPAAVAAHSRKNKEHTVSLGECLDLFAKPEVLGENDFWYCSRCKDLRQATKQIELWKAPDILTIHLKRFSNFQSFRDKISDVVEFPIQGLDMDDRVQGPHEKGSLIYDLFAVDNHFGGLGGGHYTAYAKNAADGKWYYFDDSSVTPADPERAISGAAYLLFYRRRSAKPLGELEGVIQSAQEAVRESRAQHRREQLAKAVPPATPQETVTASLATPESEEDEGPSEGIEDLDEIQDSEGENNDADGTDSYHTI